MNLQDVPDTDLYAEIERRKKLQADAHYEALNAMYGTCACGAEIQTINVKEVESFYESQGMYGWLAEVNGGDRIGGKFEHEVICENKHMRIFEQYNFVGKEPGDLIPILIEWPKEERPWAREVEKKEERLRELQRELEKTKA